MRYPVRLDISQCIAIIFRLLVLLTLRLLAYMLKRTVIWVCAFVLIQGAAIALAEHPLSVVDATVFVQKFKTTMQLTCSADELEILQGVEALENGFYDSDELIDANEDHAKFLAERIELLDVNGEKHAPRITDIQPLEIPDNGIRDGSLVEYKLNYTLEFKYDQPPEFLTITQNLIAEGAVAPSEVKVVLKQTGSDEPMLQVLKPAQPHNFNFDWTRPPLTSDLSEEDRKKWFDEQRKKTLGISSFNIVYDYIYITDTEVRQEVLIPLSSLSSFVELDRAEDRFLTIPEQEAARAKIEALFRTKKIKVLIDGVEVPPRFDRIDFYGLQVRDLAKSQQQKISMATGRVGLIMSYSTKGVAQQVDVTWNLFNEVVKTIDGRVFEYDKVKLWEFRRFLPDGNPYQWKNPGRPPLPPLKNIDSSQYSMSALSIPILSCVLGVLAFVILALGRKLFGTTFAIGLATLCGVGAFLAQNALVYRTENPYANNVEATDEIFAQLHKNVFRAFDYHREEAIYDALANSVDGEQLRKLYIDVRESLRIAEQGGAVAKIEEVNLIEGERVDPVGELDSQGFGYRCQWNLVGTIEHWGHGHQRINTYDAVFDVQLKDNAWKITAMQIQDQKQGEVKDQVPTVN